MDAQEFVDGFRDTRALIRLSHFSGNRCDGRGWALILSDDDGIAIMIEDCGEPETTFVKAGAVVNFTCPPRKQPRIVGEAAYFTLAEIRDNRVGG
jgi:hypothetical protein